MAVQSSAILFYSTDDPSYNTNAPTGSLEGSGWQFQGQFNSYLGTPIGPHHFITAYHIGGSVGNTFYYNGDAYTTVSKVDDTGNSDFRIWKVKERFPSYAPLYSGTDENGKGLVVFGRGVDRGDAITNTVTSGSGPMQSTQAMTNGWEWGSYSYTQRWGTNKVSSVTTANGYPVLKADWDANAGTNECMLADKDSGGAVFIQENGIWKLAGINYVIGPASTYSFNSDGSNSFKAAILDFSGNSPLYIQNGSNWVTTSSLFITKSSFYATRVSSRYSWITNVIGDEFDQDVDLLPDSLEVVYSGSATGMVAAADDDSDGFSNYEEYIADTNPTNAASFFEIDSLTALTNQTVYFTGSTGREYQVYYTTNDLADSNLVWAAAHSNRVWGIGSNSSITVTNTESKAFYRLKAILP